MARTAADRPDAPPTGDTGLALPSARSLSSCEGDGNAAGRERVGSTGQPRPAPRASPLHVRALGTPARSSRRAARLGPPLPPDARCRRGRCRARTSHAFCLKAGDDLGFWSPKAASLLGRCRGGDGVSRGRRRGPRPPLPCSRPPWAPSCVSQRRRRDRRGRRLAVSRALAGRPLTAVTGVTATGRPVPQRSASSGDSSPRKVAFHSPPRSPGDARRAEAPGPARSRCRLAPGTSRQSGESPDAHVEPRWRTRAAAAIPLG